MDIQQLKSQAFGIERTIDSVGRVVIPSEIRERLGIGIGDKVEIFAVKGGVILVKSEEAEETE